MEPLHQIKAQLLNKIMDLLDQKIAVLLEDIASTKESRDNENKSSFGDKYETGRAMMQMELEKNDVQLNKTLILKKELSHIDTQKVFTQVEFGSLVVTNQGNYFISVALGKIDLNDVTYFPISLASPIGQLLQNKSIGDSIQFQDKTFIISNII